VTTYHAITLFIQNGKVFDAATRLLNLSSLPPQREEVTEHLADILGDNCNAQWGRDFEVPSRLELGELTGKEIAERLTDPLNNLPASDIVYTILTRFTEYTPEKEKDGTLKQEERELASEFGQWAQHLDNQSLGLR
jgi:hypothetical protein